MIILKLSLTAMVVRLETSLILNFKLHDLLEVTIELQKAAIIREGCAKP